MSHYPDSRIGSQHPFELIGGLRRAICDQTHSGVNAVAHSNTSALMHTHPSRASRRVQKRVQDRPISDSITTVTEHWSNVALDKTREFKRVLQPRVERLLPDIVSVLECHSSSSRHGDHSLHMRENTLTCPRHVVLRIGPAKGISFFL